MKTLSPHFRFAPLLVAAVALVSSVYAGPFVPHAGKAALPIAVPQMSMK